MLQYFTLESSFKSIRFTETVQRRTLFIEALVDVDGGIQGNMLQLLGSCHASVEYLGLGNCFWKNLTAECVASTLPTEFNCLTFIRFEGLDFWITAEVECAMALIRRSPHLQHLSVGVNGDHNGDQGAVMELLKGHGQPEFSFDRLQTVEMKNYEGTEAEMAFVGLIFAISPSLKSMLIDIHPGIGAEEQLRIVNRITTFPRVSKAVLEFV